jgi:hypothetical protein
VEINRRNIPKTLRLNKANLVEVLERDDMGESKSPTKKSKKKRICHNESDRVEGGN